MDSSPDQSAQVEIQALKNGTTNKTCQYIYMTMNCNCFVGQFCPQTNQPTTPAWVNTKVKRPNTNCEPQTEVGIWTLWNLMFLVVPNRCTTICNWEWKNDVSHALLWMVFGSETKTQSSKKMIWHNRVFHSLFVKFRTVKFFIVQTLPSSCKTQLNAASTF